MQTAGIASGRRRPAGGPPSHRSCSSRPTGPKDGIAIHVYRAEEGLSAAPQRRAAGLADLLVELGKPMAQVASPLEAMSALSDRYDNEPVG